MRDKIITLAVTFPDQPNRSEEKHAKRMADYAQTDHREVPMTGNEMLQLLPSSLDAMDQPTADAVNTFVVSYAARQAGLKVALSGLGGDELFGGYSSFRHTPKLVSLWKAAGLFRKPGARALELFGLFARKTAKVANVLDSPGGLISAYLSRRQLFTSHQIKALAPELVSTDWLSGVPRQQLEHLQSLVAGRNIYDAIGLLVIYVYMEQQLLRDSDVMGMANSLEIRLPFLDKEFSERALTLESRSRMPGKTSKSRFTEAMGDWLPRENRLRPKQGFGLPFRHWMINELREEVTEGIETFVNLAQCMRPNIVRQVWTQFCSNPSRIAWRQPWSLYVLVRFLLKNKLEL